MGIKINAELYADSNFVHTVMGTKNVPKKVIRKNIRKKEKKFTYVFAYNLKKNLYSISMNFESE